MGERTEKYSRTALQEIQIHYRYIGLLDDVIEQPASREQRNRPITRYIEKGSKVLSTLEPFSIYILS